MVNRQCNCSSCRPHKQPERSQPCASAWQSVDNCAPCPPPCPAPCPPPCPPPCPAPCPAPCPPPCPAPCPQLCSPPFPPCPPKDRCKHEHEPAQVLLPRIICSGREWQRRLCTKLSVSCLPDCAKPPFQLISVQQSGAQPWWEPSKKNAGWGQAIFHVFIPVCACVRDASGCEYFCPAVVEMDACLRLKCAPNECWRYNLIIVPCVRLVCAPVCSNDLCFDVELEVVLELFLIHWEPCFTRPPKPECKEKPLYPQPCHHGCRSSCNHD